MAYLAIPYAVAYKALNFTSGLQGVYCTIRRPDGSQIGPYPMVEGTYAFNGIYVFDFLTLITDLPGRYLFDMVSPQENGNRDVTGEFFAVPPPGTGPVGQVDKNLVIGKVAPTPTIVGQFQSPESSGVILNKALSGSIETDSQKGVIDNTNLKGTIYELP